MNPKIRINFIRLIIMYVLSSINPLCFAEISEPQLKWSRGGCTSWCMTGWYASPAVLDLDGNGLVEIVYASYKVWVLDAATGAEYWSVPTGHDIDDSSADSVGRTWPSPVVADLNADGQYEIATAHSSGWICVYDITGRFLPGWPVQAALDSEMRSLAADDFDGDGQFEIVAASTSNGDDQEWYVYNINGIARTGWPQHEGDCYAAGCYNQNIAIADIDSDGLAEVIAPNDTHYICAFSDTGDCLPTHPMYEGRFWGQVGFWVDLVAELRGWGECEYELRPNFAHSAPSIADMNLDGSLEIALIGNVHTCATNPYTDLYEVPILIQPDRSRFVSQPFDWNELPPPPGSGAWAPISQDYNMIENCQPNPVLADLNNDGLKEIIYPAYDGLVHAFTLEKTEYGHFPYHVNHTKEGIIRFASEVLVADLDGDGLMEIIFGSWPDKASGDTGKLHILSAEGDPMFEIALPEGTDDWNGMLGAPTLYDIDQDGELEIVAGTSSSGVVAYDVPGASNSSVLWGTSRGSYLRTGAIKTEFLPPEIDIELNQEVYDPGDILQVLLGIHNPGTPIRSDLYICLWVLDAAVFVTYNPSWPSFTFAPVPIELRPLPGPLSFDPVEIFSIPLGTTSLPPLEFQWYAVLTGPGNFQVMDLDSADGQF